MEECNELKRKESEGCHHESLPEYEMQAIALVVTRSEIAYKHEIVETRDESLTRLESKWLKLLYTRHWGRRTRGGILSYSLVAMTRIVSKVTAAAYVAVEIHSSDLLERLMDSPTSGGELKPYINHPRLGLRAQILQRAKYSLPSRFLLSRHCNQICCY